MLKLVKINVEKVFMQKIKYAKPAKIPAKNVPHLLYVQNAKIQAILFKLNIILTLHKNIYLMKWLVSKQPIHVFSQITIFLIMFADNVNFLVCNVKHLL